MATTSAVAQLREAVCPKSFGAKKDEGALTERQFRKNVTLCLERARLLTESYKETEGEPEVIRRAKGLKKVLDNMTIYIEDGERIVGNFASDPYSMNLLPELAVEWLDNGIKHEYRDMLDESGHEEWEKIADYWRGRNIDDRVMAVMPDSLKAYVDFNGVCHANHWKNSIRVTSNYDKLFRLGLKGIIAQAESRLDKFKNDMTVHPTDYIEQRDFLNAAIISCQGAINFSARLAHKAGQLAQAETDGNRKKELTELAEICEWVPANPPRTFHEAAQSYWIQHLITHLIETRGQGAGARLDQILHPFYKKDLESGRITRESATELIELLLIKLEGTGHISTPELHVGGVGTSVFPCLTLGGVTKEENDAINEVSFIILDAVEEIKTVQTDFAVRYHADINQDFILKTIELIGNGVTCLKFFNDGAAIPMMVNRGIPAEDARNYEIWACVNWHIPNKALKQGRGSDGVISFGKCLEFALNQGEDMLTAKKLGCSTPDPVTFTTFEDLMTAFVDQVRFIAEKMGKIDDLAQEFFVRYMSCPFGSALTDDCIEKGRDATAWAYHSCDLILATGNTNAADSLAAIKKFVFEEKALTMAELVDALKTNFEGKEELRQKLLNEAPKFGNDDDYVDLIMKEVQHRTQKEVEKIKDYYGFPRTLDGSVAGGYYPWGRRAAASADGRKSKETFADAAMSPMAGRDINGPTAVLKSMGKVPPTWAYLSNQKFMPVFLKGENRDIFSSYLKSWADLGCYHLQFNVVDRDILADAQAKPEEHTDLMVRVAGYSAYFIDLSKGVQDDIIARTAQSLG